MRDVEAYKKAGRNDPLSDDQRREHPYDFVSLPGKPKDWKGVGHDKYPPKLISGTLRLVYETLGPLHVGSGVFETAAECGLAGGETPVRGIVRSGGQRVLPGSSWKGAVRARFEAITGSRLALLDQRGKDRIEKIPEKLIKREGQKEVSIKIEDPRLHALRPQEIGTPPAGLKGLSPADAVFGCMGYRGRICPGEGTIEGPVAASPMKVKPMESPRMHRLAKPGAARGEGPTKIVITEVEGRKFYYDGDVVSSRRLETKHGVREVSEPIDYVPKGCTITLEVVVESLELAELGALLLGAGWGENVGIVRFGGFKSAGLGKVRLIQVVPSLFEGSPLNRRRRGDAAAINLEAAMREAREQLIDRGALEELHEITTRERPAV